MDSDDDNDGFSDDFEIANGFNPLNASDKLYQPIVQTLDAITKSGSSIQLQAKLVSSGGLPPSAYGFVMGTSLENMNKTINVTSSISSTQEFTTTVSNLIPGQTYFFKAFAENQAGRSWGSSFKFTVSESTWWSDAEIYEGNWRINWLGAFLPNDNGWIYHIDLGWAYVESDNVDGLWIWKDSNGWVWSNPEAWPFLWSAETSNWLYPIKSNGVLRFYDYSTSSLSAE